MKAKKIDVSKTINAYRENSFDPSGSYTGTAADGGMPTQDADDL